MTILCFLDETSLCGAQTTHLHVAPLTQCRCRTIKQEDVPQEKKLKKEDEDEVDKSLEKKIEAQNKILFKYRDQLKENLKKHELQQLLEFNGQEVPVGINDVSNHVLSDFL